MNSGRIRVAVIANGAFSIVNFRGALIAEMVRRGAEVFALAPDYDEELRSRVRQLGAEPVDIVLDRVGLRPLHDLLNTWKLSRELKRLEPDLTFGYFIKPVIFGAIAAWLAGVPRRYALIAGLGFVFIDTKRIPSASRRVLQAFTMFLYRVGLSLCDRVFFQNEDDRAHFVDAGAVRREKTTILAGTGIDVDHFRQHPLPQGAPRFLFVGRMLREKGLKEFVEAARIVRQTHPECSFAMAGDVDPNPGSLTKSEIEAFVEEGNSIWLGNLADIREELRNSTVFVLPSYREGMPRSTQEALAIGRPIITTDAVGCRQTVIPGINGWLVPVADAEELAVAMCDAVEHQDRLPEMGHASRRLAEERFDVRKINAKMLQMMQIP
jgi:glycosyltransferase involved in cell wall biosynthesis